MRDPFKLTRVTDYDIVSRDQIDRGDATDAYFLRTEEALDEDDRNPPVVAEVSADQFCDGEWEVFAGLKNATALLEGVPVDVDALHEGRLFDGGPVMRIEGNYRDFARYETSLLGFLSHASAIATAALECRRAAPDSTVLSFGARHVHPSMTATVERSALIGGLDGFSHVAAGDVLDRDPSGTMPHALQIAYGGEGSQEDAWTAFDSAVDDDVPRVALCDTYGDEVREVIRAAEALGDDLDGVRLDTTGSRRGDFRQIIEEVRWELRERDLPEVEIYVSGGLGPDDLRELRDVVDGFGVGGYVSNADPVDFGLDIVEIDGEPCAKRGKLSGKKYVYQYGRDADAGDVPRDCGTEVTTEHDPERDDLLQPLLRDGEVVREFDVDEAATRANTDACFYSSADPFE